MNRGVGTQIVLLFLVVFALGAGMSIVLIVLEDELILLYGLFFLVIGLPTLIFSVKRMSYFNQIAHNASEVAQGKMEPDLPVRGKSVLANLATDLNRLKHGVKKRASQK